MHRTNIPDEQKGHAYHNLRLKFTSITMKINPYVRLES
jgi:hypothetical protein